MKMNMELKVLTLNCWGIPGFSSNRHERMNAIAAEISTGNYDFVVLQEVWSVSDYEKLAKKSSDALPYSHYFHSGVFGSGLCVFSREPIIDTLYQRWPLNGYAHKIRHGDWFGGKGVGLCRINCNGIRINVYTAHLHAEYDRSDDEYLAHRICQAFEFSQFVKMTGGTSDLNIVAGDFNAEPSDLIYDILRVNANLSDSFVEFLDCGGGEIKRLPTNGRSENSYTSRAELRNSPNGKQIDYIMFNYNSGTSVKCLSWNTPLDKCPNQSFCFSDHEAVVAVLQVTKSADYVRFSPIYSSATRKLVFGKVDHLLESALKKLDWDQKFYFIVFAVIVCLLFGTSHVEGLPYGLQPILVVVRFVFSIAMVFCIIMGVVWNRMERNSITCVQKTVNVLLNSCDIYEVLQYGGDRTCFSSSMMTTTARLTPNA